MGNRSHHKKMRIEARAIMARTGESYQRVLARLRSRGAERGPLTQAGPVDLVSARYFGLPITLATFEILGALSCVALSARHSIRPFPDNPLLALSTRRSLN
jgi:hypothetical protein